MITTKFYLKEFTAKSGNQVYAKLYDSLNPDSNIRIGLKVKVFKECWNKDDQIAISNKIYNKREVDTINKCLSAFRDKIDNIIRTLELRNETPTAHRVKSLHDSNMEDLKTEIEKENLVYRFIDDFYQPYAAKFDFRSSPHLSYKAFAKFEAATKKHKVKDIGYSLLQEYAEWLKIEKGNSEATIHTRIKKFKAFVKSQLKYKLRINHDYENFSFKYSAPDRRYRLTIDQFNTFFLIDDLPAHLKDVKDWFILMVCFGGIRIGSAEVLDHDSLNRIETKATYFEMKKLSNTQESKSVTNPLNLYAMHILNERKWRLPKLISRQHFSEGLKEIIKMSSLKDEHFIADEIGKKNVKKYLKEKISSKVARKTFVSLNEDFGISRTVSNLMSNHSTKSKNASDDYRLSDPKYKWQKKLEVVERWNTEYYKLFPDKIPASNKQVYKLENGKELIVMNNQIVSIV